MVGYRCYILDAEDHIVQTHNLDCDSDMQAQREAGNFLSKDPYHSYVEIWRATRRVAKLERQGGARLRQFRPALRTSSQPLFCPDFQPSIITKRPLPGLPRYAGEGNCIGVKPPDCQAR